MVQSTQLRLGVQVDTLIGPDHPDTLKLVAFGEDMGDREMDL